MNKQVLRQYNIEFYENSESGKFLNSDKNWLSTYIYSFRDIQTVTEFIDDLNLALNGDFNQISDPDWSVRIGEYWNAHITDSGFEIWQNSTEKTIIPLFDMSEIMISWKEFLENS